MSIAVLQLHHREVFERNVTWAVAAGALAGLLQGLLERFLVAPPWPFLAVVAVALSAVRGDRLDKVLLFALALAVPSLTWSFGMSEGWTVALSGAGIGVLMVRSRLSDRGEEGQLASGRPGMASYALAAALGAGLGRVGSEVSGVLQSSLAAVSTPLLLTWLVCSGAFALFLALASIAAHLALQPDPVEARCEELIPTVHGAFRAQTERLLTLYRRCGELMSKLPRDPAREELARALSELTKGAVELASEWSGVEDAIEAQTDRELQAEIASLEQIAASMQDALARRHLETAAESLRQELVRVDALRLRRERILARLASDNTLLERARVALLGMRSGHAQLRAAELSALARRLSVLARAQRDEAMLADEVATGAEASFAVAFPELVEVQRHRGGDGEHDREQELAVRGGGADGRGDPHGSGGGGPLHTSSLLEDCAARQEPDSRQQRLENTCPRVDVGGERALTDQQERT